MGDIVRLDGYGYHNKKQTQGKDFYITAFLEDKNSESGVSVCVAHPLVGVVTLDSHWLIFKSRPVNLAEDWDDDIPFRPSSCSTHQGKRIDFTKMLKDIAF